jgi:hypothetical protein
MSDPAGTEPPRGGRGIKIALALSLALNLLIAGLVGGALLALGPRGGDEPRLRTLGLGPFALALDRADRAAVREGIDRSALRAERRALGAGLVQLRGALLAQPFDRAAAEAALTRARGATERLQAQGHDALLDRVETMNADERAALAGRLERALHRMAGRGRD